MRVIYWPAEQQSDSEKDYAPFSCSHLDHGSIVQSIHCSSQCHSLVLIYSYEKPEVAGWKNGRGRLLQLKLINIYIYIHMYILVYIYI
jgi:hypothetical protein